VNVNSNKDSIEQDPPKGTGTLGKQSIEVATNEEDDLAGVSTYSIVVVTPHRKPANGPKALVKKA